jgi:hypothetical protein
MNLSVQLSHRDGFAFLLQGPGIPGDSGTAFGTNIAAVRSANVPVSTLSIHRDTFSVRPGPWGGYFPIELYRQLGWKQYERIQFDGYTTSLTAASIYRVPLTNLKWWVIAIEVTVRSIRRYSSEPDLSYWKCRPGVQTLP